MDTFLERFISRVLDGILDELVPNLDTNVYGLSYIGLNSSISPVHISLTNNILILPYIFKNSLHGSIHREFCQTGPPKPGTHPPLR